MQDNYISPGMTLDQALNKFPFIEDYIGQVNPFTGDVIQDRVDYELYIHMLTSPYLKNENQQTQTKSNADGRRRVITVFRNIIGCIIGYIGLIFLEYWLILFFAFLVSIPVLGDIIRFGVEPQYIILIYSQNISAGLAGIITYYICKPTKRELRPGMIVLGGIMIMHYILYVIDLFASNGYDFSFILFAITAATASILIILAGCHCEDSNNKI